jgi:hypothetical protein
MHDEISDCVDCLTTRTICQNHFAITPIFIGEIGYDEDVLPVGHWLLNDTIRNINFDPVLLFGFIL